MKTILALTLLLTASAYGQQEPCKQGHEYFDGCNTCICSPTGLYACTRMLCPPPQEKVSKRSAGCDKGEFYYDGCNRCVCQGEVYACTLKACFDGPQFPDTVQLPQPSKATISKRSDGCDKGESYYDGCNQCVCANGAYACTERACFEGPVFADTKAVATEKVEKRSAGCDKGESYFDGCNTCVCAGTTYACTARACLPAEPVIEKAHSVQKRSDGCDKGESYYDGCNQCVCSNGAYACTQRACVTIPQFPDTVAAVETTTLDPSCDKGQSYFDGCNTCICAGTTYACTQKACETITVIPDTVAAVETTTLDPGCDKGQSYMDDCNTCVCMGGRYACTLMGCYHGPQFPDTHPAPEKTTAVRKRSDNCDKGESYFDGCNTCICMTDRSGYGCTKKQCIQLPAPTEAPEHVVHKRSDGCDKGESYFDGCNQCVCAGTTYACTARACLPAESVVVVEETTTLHPGCDRGRSFMNDCNTCVCKGGRYACTRMACPKIPELDATHSVQKRSDGCDKGESYYDGCNQCVCANGAYACTERACVELPKFADTEATTLHPSCDKGESYFDGCNTCTCTKVGGYACTKKFCIKLPEASRKRREVEVSTGKYDLPKKSPLKHLRFDASRCEPSATKNQSCNVCKCTKNGKGWLCTQNACTSSKA